MQFSLTKTCSSVWESDVFYLAAPPADFLTSFSGILSLELAGASSEPESDEMNISLASMSSWEILHSSDRHQVSLFLQDKSQQVI